MATKDELRLSMGKVADWNDGKPGLLKFTMGGEPQSFMVTPANMNGQMQVGQLCAFKLAHDGTSHRQAIDCVPLPLNTTADEAADIIKRMNLNPATTSDLIDRMNLNAATYERDFTLYVPALTRDGHSLVMSELEHFWSMTDCSYSFGSRAIQLLNTLRLDGVQFNMTYYVWGNGSDDDLGDGLLVLLTSVIKDEILAQEKKAACSLREMRSSCDLQSLRSSRSEQALREQEQINLVTINIYKQGMASKCEGYYEDPHNGYVVEIATEDIISATFDYDRDTIEDVFLKLIEPNELGTSDTHYLKTVAGRILQDNSSTLISVNKGRPIDTSAIFFMPELFFELCPRFGPLANEPSYFDSPDGTKKPALSLNHAKSKKSIFCLEAASPWLVPQCYLSY